MPLLPPPNYRNGNPPEFFKLIRENEQARLDNLYLHGVSDSVDSYAIASAGWIDDQKRKREASPDPANYKPEPFTRPVPVREVFDIDENGQMYSWFMPPDPNIHPPVLPDYVPPAPTGFKSTPDPKDAALFSLLVLISQKLDKLLAK